MSRLLQRLAARANDTAVLLRPDPRPVAGISAIAHGTPVARTQPLADDAGTPLLAARIPAALVLPDAGATTRAHARNGFVAAPPRAGPPDPQSPQRSVSDRVPESRQMGSGNVPCAAATESAPVPARPSVPEQPATTPPAPSRALARPTHEAAASIAPSSAATREPNAQYAHRAPPRVEQMTRRPLAPDSAANRIATTDSEHRFPTMLLSPAPAQSITAPLGGGARNDATELHIHIGRIDVTAVREPAAARRKPTSAQAPTSLDAYLAHRRRS